MTIWISSKAKPHELKNRKKSEHPQTCRICGKPTNNNKKYCNSCYDFIKNSKKGKTKE